MMTETKPEIERRIEAAIAKLRALRQGEAAVRDLVACGPAAIGPLREFLFERDVSGMFQPRCQAVEALAALGAKDVLLEFLANPRILSDPVEQAGDDAVMNAVARALMRWPDERVFAVLMKRARRKLLAGVVEALGEYRREEALPVLTAALGDDFCRPAAEKGFRKLGAAALPALRQLADTRTPSPDNESESSRRRRRSALGLLAELTPDEELLPLMQPFMADDDAGVALFACSICLPRVSPAERGEVAVRLIALLDTGDWLLQAEVEDFLIQYYKDCRPVVEQSLAEAEPGGPAAASLRRVVIKGCAALGLPLPEWLRKEIEAAKRKAERGREY